MSRGMYWLFSVLLAGIISIPFVLLYRTFFPPTILTLNRPIKVLRSIYKPGDILSYELDYCKDKAYEASLGETHFTFIDDVAIPVPSILLREVPTGCHVVVEGVQVPDMAPGSYELEMVRIYETLFSRAVVRSTSQHFNIEAR